MAQNDHSGVQPIGLDIGTSRIVTAFTAEEGYSYLSELNSFVTLPHSKLTESVLVRENVPHTVRGSEILVHGNESARFADLLQTETRRPMSRGFLNPAEPEALNIIREIVRKIAGPAQGENQAACFSVPAAPLEAGENLTYHEATLRQLLGELGYRVRSINEGLAVVFAELANSNYTGIGISFGGGLCNVCLAYLAVPVVSFSLAKAGDFIDSSVAAVTGDLVNRVRITKEDALHFNGIFTDKTLQALVVYYEDMIQTLVAALKQAFSDVRSLPRLGRPVPIVLSGGSVLPAGFCDRFAQALRASEFPLPVAGIRLAENPLYATAKGALVAALSEM